MLIRFANCINLERDPLKFDHPIVIPGLDPGSPGEWCIFYQIRNPDRGRAVTEKERGHLLISSRCRPNAMQRGSPSRALIRAANCALAIDFAG